MRRLSSPSKYLQSRQPAGRARSTRVTNRSRHSRAGGNPEGAPRVNRLGSRLRGNDVNKDVTFQWGASLLLVPQRSTGRSARPTAFNTVLQTNSGSAFTLRAKPRPARQPQHRGRGVHSRSAFTLLELMLALGLTIALLTVVYSAMELHWRFSTLGQVEVERAQIARAVLTRMSADIRSVMYRAE